MLASVTFGAIFGRAEKGFMMSIKNKIESAASKKISQKNRETTIYTLLIIPLSLIIGVGVTYYKLNNISDAELGISISIALSVFISTFLVALAFFYTSWALTQLIQSTMRWRRNFREEDITHMELARQKLESKFDKMLSWGKDDQSNSAFPDEVGDVLRETAKQNDEN